jgi:flavin reductase ActVB
MTITAPEKFREAMSSFPSGVTIMTTVDARGERRGFAASSFCSLSMDPPLVLVCLSKTAQCHDAFLESDDWAIQMATSEHVDLISRFATKGSDKFGGGEFDVDDRGVPVLHDAAVVLGCRAHDRYDGGDHTILVALVETVALQESAPALYFQREFRELELSPGDLGETA